MKLKKSISLLLVLAIALMSFAFVVSAAEDTVNVAIVPNVDTTTLEVGDTFVANIELSEISAKELRGVAVGISFDPEVLQVVDEKGNVAPDDNSAVAFIPCKDLDTFFMYVPNTVYNVDNEAGKVTYSIAPNMENMKNSLPVESGEYTAVGIRFKAVGTGSTELAFIMEDVAVNCSSLLEKATVTDKTEATRIGVAQITDVLAVEGEFSVDVDTALEDAVKALPEKVSVKYDDDTVAQVAVNWTCDDYEAEVPGEYTFVGTVEGTDKTASVKLTVKKLEIYKADQSVVVNVPFGATEEQIAELLPATVTVSFSPESPVTVQLPVTWTYTYEAGVTSGEVVLEGTLDLGTKYANTAEVKAAGKLNVSAKIDAETAGTVETVVEDAKVTYEAEATKEDIIAVLPKTVDIKVGDATVTAFITWDSADYDAATAGDYTFVGTIVAPENVTLESDTITITVTVAEALEKVVVEVTDVLEDQEVKGSKDKLTTLFPETVAVKYQDGTTGTEAIVWDDASKKLDATKKGEYTLNGMVGAVAVTAKVKVTSSVEPPTTDPAGTVYIYANNKTLNNNTLQLFTTQVVVLRTSKAVKSWSSSNVSVASVTADGKLVGRAPGEVLITATAADGSVGYFTVRVILNPSTIAGLEDAGKEDSELVIPFTDLADYSWAARMICELANAGVVSGKTETTYAPADNVTRAEYASLLVRAMKLSANGAGKEFTDVAANDWYYKSVQTASALGIVSGYEDGSFRPDASITREEMAVMTQRAAEAAGRALPAQVEVSFTDADQISGFAKDAVNALAGAQIINGMGDGNFAPQATANRAQAAVIIYKLTEL